MNLPILMLLQLGVRSLLAHKLRSFLTVLGLVFGVASVIIMLAVGEGASYEAQQQIQSLGAKNLIVRSKKPVRDAQKSEEQEGALIYGLTYQDLDSIQATIPTVQDVTPQREFRQEVRYLDRSLDCRVAGVTESFLGMNGLHLADGRFLTSVDEEKFRNVCVLGHELAVKLFPFSSPIGKAVRVGPRHYYTVVGITGFRAPSAGVGSSLAAHDYNLDCYIPLSTDRVRFGELLIHGEQGSFSYERIELSQITIGVDNIHSVKPTAEVIKSLLMSLHDKEDYSITVPLELLESAEETKRIFNIVLGSTAAISLIVGGIGIMNIMLATVTERTKEIGIRTAVGATSKDIVSQFLVETAVLSLVGSMVGLAIGLAAPPLVSWVSGVKTIVTPWSVVASIGVALIVGVVFGIYPAMRAANLDPIEALRTE
jgi:putative ABC transport system permease protein